MPLPFRLGAKVRTSNGLEGRVLGRCINMDAWDIEVKEHIRAPGRYRVHRIVVDRDGNPIDATIPYIISEVLDGLDPPRVAGEWMDLDEPEPDPEPKELTDAERQAITEHMRKKKLHPDTAKMFWGWMPEHMRLPHRRGKQ